MVFGTAVYNTTDKNTAVIDGGMARLLGKYSTIKVDKLLDKCYCEKISNSLVYKEVNLLK